MKLAPSDTHVSIKSHKPIDLIIDNNTFENSGC